MLTTLKTVALAATPSLAIRMAKTGVAADASKGVTDAASAANLPGLQRRLVTLTFASGNQLHRWL